MDILHEIEREQVGTKNFPEFGPGDTVRVHSRVVEGQRERIQVFEGVVLKINHKNTRRSVTVRRVTGGIGVERTFLLDSPALESMEVTRRGKVRRARLYYLRERIGKKAKVKELRGPAGPRSGKSPGS